MCHPGLLLGPHRCSALRAYQDSLHFNWSVCGCTFWHMPKWMYTDFQFFLPLGCLALPAFPVFSSFHSLLFWVGTHGFPACAQVLGEYSRTSLDVYRVHIEKSYLRCWIDVLRFMKPLSHSFWIANDHQFHFFFAVFNVKCKWPKYRNRYHCSNFRTCTFELLKYFVRYLPFK